MWTEHVPPELVEAIRKEFGHDEHVADLLTREDGDMYIEEAMGNLLTNPSFLSSPQAFLDALETVGVAAMKEEAEAFERRNKPYLQWCNEDWTERVDRILNPQDYEED